ncbi:MAG: hypothetical protein PWR20_1246 [Bacteroidales bacterium]|jgi:cbb3-type cytochrome oxidase subunit 3|nr:hypothetical protein [Bacteroidales bacterium]MDN5330326.1 hypothetical protein [Bacteroidales bacterium]NLH52521.1 cbb3-type cytochrome c oxidase subunit 3 [Bacteroidales bacterium]NPV36750.1 CcoQ/FixQ family Cbb3-type cytochrome c oxidase assembly chaperone [Bacteroidales bacterium]
MKLIQYALGEFAANGIYQAIALIIFMLVFIAIVIHTYSLKKSFVDQMAQSPLDESNPNVNSKTDQP